MKKISIILGGGDGTRAGGSVPKQFQMLHGEPVLMHSIKAMQAGDATITYVVLHASFLYEWEEILSSLPFAAKCVCGGKTRWHSVKNALLMVEQDGIESGDLIAVHDGARPLVPKDVVERGWREASEYKSAVPAIKVTDSLRQINAHDKSVAVNRENYKSVQTPQIFEAKLLVDAYKMEYNPTFTDDASVVETYGTAIHLFNGAIENIKITHPLDLAIAELYMNKQHKD